MKIFSIIIFGFALARTLIPLINKEKYKTFPIFFGVFCNAVLYLIAYLWFLNSIINGLY